ncbi:TonB-dependent receptor [Teredinibacter turnerae]|uniref:TonB-dependent receptor n=1 Tax=Teredinibacter turnerae TaxID=2426 RepID=UPI00035EC77E|nr:TonB-dependent receptor [Teredinibacter turnerae]
MKLDSSYFLLLAGLCISFSTVVAAEESQLETVLIIGNKTEILQSDLVGSLDLLTNDELTYEHVDDTLEIFNKVPGVYLSRYNQGIINTDVSIRGFAGDGVTPHAKLLIDGVPANLHNGYNELDQLFPMNIASLAVFKGTSDPRYGIFNIAGNYNVSTRQDDAKEVELTLGSFNTQEVQGYLGTTQGNFKQNYALGYRTSEGYRDHTDIDKYALSGSWQWGFDSERQFRISARHAGYDGDAPGYLSEEEAKDDPTQSASYANQDGGNKETSHLSAHWNQPFADNVDWSLKAYWQTFERERWVRFSGAPDSSVQNRFDDQALIGFISTIDWSLNPNWMLTWGLDYESQDNIEQRFGTIGQSRIRDESKVSRNYQFDFISLGSYLKIANEPSEKLRWNFAVRVDQLDGDFTDETKPDAVVNKKIFEFGTIVQPKFNLVYSVTEDVNLFSNLGRSFQHPLGSAAYTAGDTSEKDVSINDGVELGLQWQLAKNNIRLSWWQQKAKDEFVLLDETYQNVGKTKRDGIDIAFTGDITDSWSYWGSYTLINSEVIVGDESLGVPDVEGNELRSIPDFTASLGLNYQVTSRLITRLHLDAQGDYFVNEANAAGQYGDYAILSLSADYDAGWSTFKVQLNNLTDEYFAYVYDFSTDGKGPIIHSPGDGFNGSLSIQMKF